MDVGGPQRVVTCMLGVWFEASAEASWRSITSLSCSASTTTDPTGAGDVTSSTTLPCNGRCDACVTRKKGPAFSRLSCQFRLQHAGTTLLVTRHREAWLHQQLPMHAPTKQTRSLPIQRSSGQYFTSVNWSTLRLATPTMLPCYFLPDSHPGMLPAPPSPHASGAAAGLAVSSS